jgi:hypothetical protein
MKRYIEANIYIRVRSVGSLKRFFIPENISGYMQMGKTYSYNVWKQSFDKDYPKRHEFLRTGECPHIHAVAV